MTESRDLSRAWIGVAGGGLFSVAAAALAAISAATSTAPADVARECWALFLPRLTAQSVVTLALGALACAVLIAGATSLLRQLWASNRFVRGQRALDEIVVFDEPVRLIASAGLEAFTAGVLRPRVHLSACAHERLTPQELEAVVAHEAHHRHNRDPLRLMIAGAFGAAFFFVPAARTLAESYGRLTELRADASAVGRVGSERSLASALFHFTERQPVVGAGIAAERVDQLAGRRVRLGLPLALLGAALAAILAVTTAAALVSIGGPDRDAAHLPGFLEQACILARALLPVAGGATLLAVGRSLSARTAKRARPAG